MRCLKVFLPPPYMLLASLVIPFLTSPSTLGSLALSRRTQLLHYGLSREPTWGVGTVTSFTSTIPSSLYNQLLLPPSLHFTLSNLSHVTVQLHSPSQNTAVSVLFWTIKLIFVLMVCFRRGVHQLTAKRDCGTCSRWAFGTLRLLWGTGNAGKSDGFLPPCTEPFSAGHPACVSTKDHSRRGRNAAAAITLSPLRAEGNRVRGKVNTAFAVPYQGSCHQCRAFWCICLRTRLPHFQITIEQIACTKQGIMEAFLRRGRLASSQAHSFYLHHLISFLQSSLHCFRTWCIPYPTKSFLFLCHASIAPVCRKHLDVKFDLSHYVSFLLRLFDSPLI